MSRNSATPVESPIRPATAEGTGGGLSVPLEPYRSPEFFAAERERLFGRAWLLMGRIEELPTPRSHVVKRVDICNASILITRDGGDIVRAFHNICPHRANLLVRTESGSGGTLVCNYHNWSFSLDGSLKGVPGESMFGGLDKKKCGLKPIALSVWEGWIFINLDPEPAMTLEEFLGDMAPYLSGLSYPYADTPVVLEVKVKCNWKVVMDAFAEAYHLPALHRNTICEWFSDRSNAFGKPLTTRIMGLHAVNSMYGNPDYAPGDRNAFERIVENPAHMASDHVETLNHYRAHAAVNPTKTARWSMDVNYIFPNVHIDSIRTGFLVHHFWPVSVDEAIQETRMYVRRPRTIRERIAFEFHLARAFDVYLEDLSNVEYTQVGINSRATDTIPLSEAEILIHHSITKLQEWISG
ncbi:(2Fe-2S)-binding protein [Sphingobium sp. TA15]|uniref:Putative dioxygenase n=1 Tax=Sphingobium indicum (strain DSM 16413 / CCM 7287 / MTCC 6362 / UT26 / NBRC 101211 / UT26S) TaxID=452662 RepID=D4Z8B5_SPHIU|nr:aromatic ring-hydroxylating dioxygenase subunit alpha [Sphingobium indicum]BAI98734.1 putative dioxygenase [Sphingobium indicum UT26S]BDD68784.1 (2Fe-2S)-binding protein [Sphingobium sp. TA15]